MMGMPPPPLKTKRVIGVKEKIHVLIDFKRAIPNNI